MRDGCQDASARRKLVSGTQWRAAHAAIAPGRGIALGSGAAGRVRRASSGKEQRKMDTNLASKLLAAARAGDVAQVRALLPPCGNPEEDGPPDAPGGVTPLMAAAAGGHEAVVEVLLECGADAARRDAKGRTAAHHARAAGHPHLAERLDTVVAQDQTMR